MTFNASVKLMFNYIFLESSTAKYNIEYR